MNEMYEKLLAKDNEETVNALFSRTAYGYDKSHVSKKESSIFKYPCVYLIHEDEYIKLFYSNTNKNGHFGIPKVIWSRGISIPIIDTNGEYGLTNFAYGIIDEVNNLSYIKKAMLNPEFLKIMEYINELDGNNGQRYNFQSISIFRKDFWVNFV